MYQPLPSKCKEDHEHAHKKRDDTRIMQFLAGLSSNYLPVRDHVVMQDPLPPLTIVYAMCQRAMTSTLPSHSFVPPERSAHLAGDQSSLGLRVPSLSSGRISGFAGRGRGREGDRSRGSRSLRGRGGRGRGRDGSRICSHCGGTNHTIDYCWQLHGRPTYVAASVASTVTSETVFHPDS